MGAEIVKVAFHGDELHAVQKDGEVFVVVKRVCELLCVDDRTQREKLSTKSWARGGLITLHDATGRNQELYCLHLDAVPMWFATIDAERVGANIPDEEQRERIRDRIVRYQNECAKVLRDHFFKTTPANESPTAVVVANDNARAKEGFAFILEALIRVGVPETRAAVSVITDASVFFGSPATAALKSLPVLEEPRADLNATNLGKLIGLGAVKTNQRLADLGLQVRSANGEWALTKEGMKYGQAHEFKREMANGAVRSGMQILWFASAADALKGS